MVYNHILKKLDIQDLTTIIEVGGRYGTESVDLANDYPNSIIHCFECNPNTIKKCKEVCSTKKNIIFNPIGVSETGEKFRFFSYIKDNDGCSIFYNRIDGEHTMKNQGAIDTITLYDYMETNKIKNIDCLCLDTQGSELDIIKGLKDKINKVSYIILEQPNEIPNKHYLPPNTYSKYIGAPDALTIKNYLESNGFEEIYRQKENEIENNVVYKYK